MNSELTLQEVFDLNAAFRWMLSEDDLTTLRHLFVQHNLTFDDIRFTSSGTEALFVPYYDGTWHEIVIRMPDTDELAGW